MRTENPGLASRRARVHEHKSGSWGTSSQDFAQLARLLLAHSAQYAAGIPDRNCSPYSLAGIPMLFSALRCLLVELNGAALGTFPIRQEALDQLANSSNDVRVVLDRYALPDGVKRNLQLLLDVRHEIVHPAHRPGGEVNNTPEYLRELRERGLLQSTGKDADYIWLSQLQSHRLFIWAFEVVRATAAALLQAHSASDFVTAGILASYSVDD